MIKFCIFHYFSWQHQTVAVVVVIWWVWLGIKNANVKETQNPRGTQLINALYITNIKADKRVAFIKNGSKKRRSLLSDRYMTMYVPIDSFKYQILSILYSSSHSPCEDEGED